MVHSELPTEMNMDRKIVVFSGLNCGGKSHWLNRIRAHPRFECLPVVRMDDVRIALFGDRADTHITPSEHLYKNERVRQIILEHLVLGAEGVMTELILPTREGHQRPMLGLAERADAYVQAIEQESAKRDNLQLPTPSRVHLRVILLHCSLSAAKRRLESAERQRSGSAVFDMKGMRGATLLFEPPAMYTPLILDTSLETPEAVRRDAATDEAAANSLYATFCQPSLKKRKTASSGKESAERRSRLPMLSVSLESKPMLYSATRGRLCKP